MTTRRIGILTGGGDAPGLNAVIRAVVNARQVYDLRIEEQDIEEVVRGIYRRGAVAKGESA